MGWHDGKKPVHFHKWQPYAAILGRRGWLFYHNMERVAISSYELSQLLKEEKAWLVIDEHEWERLVERYRGKKQHTVNPNEQKKADIKTKAMKLGREHEALSKEYQEKWKRAQEMLNKDPAKAAPLARELNVLGQRRNALEQEAKKLKKELEVLERAA